MAGYLDFRGLAASAPNQRPPGSAVPADTIIRVYNGAETRLPLTVALLEDVFGVQALPVTDPAVKVDVVVTTGPRDPGPPGPASRPDRVGRPPASAGDVSRDRSG